MVSVVDRFHRPWCRPRPILLSMGTGIGCVCVPPRRYSEATLAYPQLAPVQYRRRGDTPPLRHRRSADSRRPCSRRLLAAQPAQFPCARLDNLYSWGALASGRTPEDPVTLSRCISRPLALPEDVAAAKRSLKTLSAAAPTFRDRCVLRHDSPHLRLDAALHHGDRDRRMGLRRGRRRADHRGRGGIRSDAQGLPSQDRSY